MGLFQRNPHTHSQHTSIYTLGQEKTILIVGLGNTGKKYAKNRHNAGFMAVDAFAIAHEFESWQDKKSLKCAVASKTLGDTRVIVAKPQTMMNLSGEAIQAVASYFKVKAEDIVVVYDELDIAFGQLRMRSGGSAGGHNGIKSVLQHIDDNFKRVRIGIKSETQLDSADYVLSNFSKEEQAHLKAMTREVVSILTEYVYSGSFDAETRSFMV